MTEAQVKALATQPERSTLMASTTTMQVCPAPGWVLTVPINGKAVFASVLLPSGVWLLHMSLPSTVIWLSHGTVKAATACHTVCHIGQSLAEELLADTASAVESLVGS